MSTPDVFSKQYLLTAGPTPLPPRVLSIAAEPILYHRAPAFMEIYERVLGNLPRVFQTSNQVLCFGSSGSGGMESAAANLIVPGDTVIVASCGKFGQRWAQLAEAFGANLHHLEFEWGTPVDPAAIEEKLKEIDGPVKAVFTTFSETSTGVLNDVKTINEIVTNAGSILVVDAVSGLGAANLPQDDWGIDVVVAGSQKALMCPPGLGFASVSPRALEIAAANPGRRYYFDWEKTAKGQAKANSPFTPAVSLFMALDVALTMILEEEGLENVFARHAVLAKAARAGIAALGLERFGPDNDDANVVTGAWLPEEIEGGKVPGRMRDVYGVTIAGGQDHLKGKIARIAHCGYFGGFDIITALTALEMALRDLGYDIPGAPGAGAGAAQLVFAEHGSVPQPA